MALMLIVAGNNGAGKTTLTSSVMGTSLNGFTWINPDDTTDDLIQRYPEFAINRTYPNLAAAWVSEMRVEALIDNGTDFIVETVLASTKYLDRVRKAKTNGMRIGMIYITLETPIWPWSVSGPGLPMVGTMSMRKRSGIGGPRLKRT